MRQVGALRNLQNHRLFLAGRRLVILRQFGSEVSGLGPDDVVVPGVVIRRAAENVDPNLLFGHLVGLLQEGALGHVLQECFEPR